jgi:hypothetical protein
VLGAWRTVAGDLSEVEGCKHVVAKSKISAQGRKGKDREGSTLEKLPMLLTATLTKRVPSFADQGPGETVPVSVNEWGGREILARCPGVERNNPSHMWLN